jgi:predicted deacetylase
VPLTRQQMQALLKPLLDQGHRLNIHAYPQRTAVNATSDWFYVEVANLAELSPEKVKHFSELAKRYGCEIRIYVTDGSVDVAGKLRVQFL